ncbi:MAG: LysM peptidoglycan-binding domain-containing protein [Lachnospiraceae bacterium]|nr:LysM peptidoglycan-binding domain-containing protein [Lachnospiraceae bacterium]
MRSIKRGLAVLLAVLLMMPTLPATAEELVNSGSVVTVSGNESVSDNESIIEDEASVDSVVDEVKFNTGDCTFTIVDPISFENGFGDDCFAEDGSYTILLTEANPFFPYEVQFTHNGNVFSEWFMTPDDSVEVGGHTFNLMAFFDNEAITQMSLNVAGDTVIVYPEAKEFTEGGGFSFFSLLPLEEKSLTVDLTGYTPIELTQVSINEIFAGENLVEGTDKIMLKTKVSSDGTEYEICETGDKVNLSYSTYYSSSNTWEMIVGEVDQLAASNIRYSIRVNQTASRNWLVPQAYVQGEDGTRTSLEVVQNTYYDGSSSRYLDLYVSAKGMQGNTNAYISLSVNSELYPTVNYSQLKAYSGWYDTVEEAMAATDITDQLFAADMTQANAGYLVNMQSYSSTVTLVAFDANNNVVGFIPLRIYHGAEGNEMNGYLNSNYYVSYWNTVDGISTRTYELYAGQPANAEMGFYVNYYQSGKYSNELITAAYLGNYTTIADAVAANATDVLADIKGNGYRADYSQGVYLSVFVGADGTADQEVYRFLVKTVEGTQQQSSSSSSSSSTYISFDGVKDANGYVDSYIISTNMDSYGEGNYWTILVDKDTDLTNLAPLFYVYDSDVTKVYTAGSSTPEVSGESFHDFSQGPIQYTVAAEDGINSKNYWVQVLQATEGPGKLYMNSLNDPETNTREENGVVYTTRSVMLDSYHSNKHYIFLANVGTEAIDQLSAELVSDVVELDEYWTLKGKYELSGFNRSEEDIFFDELANMAKLSIKKKASVENGTDITGTLTIKSGETVLMVMTLTGTVGDPTITTKEVPEAVKYVPYGTMIQNSNKYSWNKVTYKLYSGKLPGGMILKPNGEVYGVPTEAGSFRFCVYMDNSYSGFSDTTRWFTLVVNENTNENVENATDEGYVLSERVDSVALTSTEENYTVVSEGEYAEFVDLYLDGVKLVDGEDYDSESGSTRITIKSQTLKMEGADSIGTHTLGIEFRTKDTDELKRAAQNFEIVETEASVPGTTPAPAPEATPAPAPGTTPAPAPAPETNPAPAPAPAPSTGSNNAAQDTTAKGNDSAAASTEVTTTSYTIAAGDSLWKIAKKFYGDGNLWTKIYEDNANVLSSPDKIYVGQVLVIKSLSEAPSETITTVPVVVAGSNYTVESGDSLWKIAKKVYGDGSAWRKIYNANKDVISNPENIYKGQVLAIPEA